MKMLVLLFSIVRNVISVSSVKSQVTRPQDVSRCSPNVVFIVIVEVDEVVEVSKVVDVVEVVEVVDVVEVVNDVDLFPTHHSYYMS